jgi:hypothetical protein
VPGSTDPTPLRINWQHVGWNGPPLPRVTSLRLHDFQGTEDLSDLPVLFPGLRRLVIMLAPTVDGVPEHVLAALPVVPTVSRVHGVI